MQTVHAGKTASFTPPIPSTLKARRPHLPQRVVSGAVRVRAIHQDDTGIAARPVAVVTGATSGIGHETVIGMAKRGYHVVAIARNEAKAAALRDEVSRLLPAGQASIDTRICDVANLQATRSLAQTLRGDYPAIDALINSAGVLKRDRELTPQGIETNLAVNALAPWVLSRMLAENLARRGDGRVVQLNSEGHRGTGFWGKPATVEWDNLQGEKAYSMFETYNHSKLIFLLLSYELHPRLQEEGLPVHVNSVHPGVIRTDLGRDMPKALTGVYHLFPKSPEEGAEPVIRLATEKEVAGGGYFKRMGQAQSSPASLDVETAQRLWQSCSTLVGLADRPVTGI